MEYANLQRLAVIPYANSSWVIPKGKRGYWTWRPDINCWPSILEDCDNDDDLDGIMVMVCGLRIDRKGKNESDAEYRGRLWFVEDNDPNSGIKPGVRPWPEYEEAVEMAEEWENNDVDAEESLATKSDTAFSIFTWTSVVSLFLVI